MESGRPRAPANASRPRVTRPAPLPQTRDLPIEEALEAIRREEDDGRRWRIVEENLELKSPERTYHLLAHFGTLVGERAVAWPESRMLDVLGHQPGALLVPIVAAWPVEKILVLADANVERQYVLDWLHDREVERLMRLDPDRQVTDLRAAREWLGVEDRRLSAGRVKQVWRLSLGFLNADYGRRREMAIHRRKDEIAKRLQQARDLLVARAGNV